MPRREEYQEPVRAAFPHSVEVGTLPSAGGDLFVVVGFTLEGNGYKACFALTTHEARSLAFDLDAIVIELEGGDNEQD